MERTKQVFPFEYNVKNRRLKLLTRTSVDLSPPKLSCPIAYPAA
jgi:hypothetical protein